MLGLILGNVWIENFKIVEHYFSSSAFIFFCNDYVITWIMINLQIIVNIFYYTATYGKVDFK